MDLHSAHCLMLIDICLRFHEYGVLSGFQVIEWPWIPVTDRQKGRQTDSQQTDKHTERRMDGRPGINNKSPNPKGGDIIKVFVLFVCLI